MILLKLSSWNFNKKCHYYQSKRSIVWYKWTRSNKLNKYSRESWWTILQGSAVTQTALTIYTQLLISYSVVLYQKLWICWQ